MKIIEHIQSNKHFYSSVGSLNLGALCCGLAMGWPNPSFTYLYDRYNVPVAALYLDVSWIESVINVGACVGSLVSIFVSDIFGRRMSFYLSASILVGFWIFLASIGTNRIMLTFAASWAGVGVGLFSATAVLYIVEISSSTNRGIIGTSVILMNYTGIFILSLWGNYFKMTYLLSIMTTFPICFFVAVHYFMIESPFYLLQKGFELEAKVSLKNLRDRKNFLEVDEEFKSIEAFFKVSKFQNSKNLMLKSMFPETMRTLTMLVIPVLCVSQMMGVTAISDYAQSLIEKMYPTKGKLFVSTIDIVSIIFCLFAIDRVGRKPLLAFTSLGSGLCCLIFGLYNLLNARECRTSLLPHHSTLSVIVLCIYYAIYALGAIPVFPIVTSEIFPSRAKTAAVGIYISLLYLTAFSMNVSYKTLNRRYSCLAFAWFTLLSSVGLPFAIALLPETKGKSLSQIQNDLENIVVTNY